MTLSETMLAMYKQAKKAGKIPTQAILAEKAGVNTRFVIRLFQGLNTMKRVNAVYDVLQKNSDLTDLPQGRGYDDQAVEDLIDLARLNVQPVDEDKLDDIVNRLKN